MEWHNISGNPLVPSVQRKKIKSESQLCMSIFRFGIPKRLCKMKKKIRRKSSSYKIRQMFCSCFMTWFIQYWHLHKEFIVFIQESEIVKSVTFRSSPLLVDGFLPRKLKYSLPGIFSAITHFCQTKYFPSSSSR